MESEPESRGVVACDGKGNGCVLWYAGASLANEIEEGGLVHLGDLGLDDAPNGISVWEGRYFWTRGPYEYPDDGDSYPSGKFRDPTEEEWQKIRAGRCPWKGKAPDA